MIAKVIPMEKLLEQALLYDFYGELLTDRQKEIYEKVVLDDLSLSEAAEEEGISRQGVHDAVKRCEKILEGYEEKLRLVEKFLHIKARASRMDELAEKLEESGDMRLVGEMRKISNEILEEL